MQIEYDTQCERKSRRQVLYHEIVACETGLLKEIGEVCAFNGESKKRAIIEFTANAVCGPDPFDTKHTVLDKEIETCIEWRKQMTNQEANAFREKAISDIEQMGAAFWKEGRVEQWMGPADSWIKQIAKDVNGPLLEHLAREVHHNDPDCVSFFKFGAPLAGPMPTQGGENNKLKASIDTHQLKQQCRERNRKTIDSLKEDKHSSELLREIRAEVAEGRMTSPRDLAEEDLDSILLAKRFSVEQGVKEDGSVKIRAVDEETQSGVNLCTDGGDKIKCDGLDALIRAIHQYSFYNGGFKKLGLWKADIKSAYRRIPLQPKHRWMAWIILVTQGQAKIARHNSLMFGAVGSVLGWDRLGELLRVIALRALRIPSLRWVDDYFHVEPLGTLEHTKACFARLIRALLGEQAIEPKKLEHGNPLTILGVDVCIGSKEITVWPTKSKVQLWQQQLLHHQTTCTMSAGAASKMAGRLNVAFQNCFKQFGRTMVKPFYCQQYAPTVGAKCNNTLQHAIKWWLEIFDKDLTQSISLKRRGKTVDIFCDASGAPPIIAGVLFQHSQVKYCVANVPVELTTQFEKRNDDQIMGLELYAIWASLETFERECHGASVRIWTDNVGGEHALHKQSAKSRDHNYIIHKVWKKAAEINAGLWINRVPSSENIADGPTRPDENVGLSLLKHLGATKVHCKLPCELPMFCH